MVLPGWQPARPIARNERGGPRERRRLPTCARDVQSGERSASECSTLQALVALAVVAAALLDPGQPAIAVARLVGVVLVEAGVHARLAGRLGRIFRGDGAREHRIADIAGRGGGGRL